MKLVGCPDRLRSALLPSKLTSITNKKIKYSHLTRMHPLGSFGFLDLTVVPVPLCVLVPSDFNICLLTNYTKIPGVSSNEGGYVRLQNYPGLGSAECILHEEQGYTMCSISMVHYICTAESGGTPQYGGFMALNGFPGTSVCPSASQHLTHHCCYGIYWLFSQEGPARRTDLLGTI